MKAFNIALASLFVLTALVVISPPAAAISEVRLFPSSDLNTPAQFTEPCVGESNSIYSEEVDEWPSDLGAATCIETSVDSNPDDVRLGFQDAPFSSSASILRVTLVVSAFVTNPGANGFDIEMTCANYGLSSEQWSHQIEVTSSGYTTTETADYTSGGLRGCQNDLLVFFPWTYTMLNYLRVALTCDVGVAGECEVSSINVVVQYLLPGDDEEPPGGPLDEFFKFLRPTPGIPEFPPEMPLKCKDVGRLDWLLPVADVGSRNVTIEDNRREASLAVNYVIAWGDGTGNVYSKLPATHTYEDPGVYRITMRVQYRDGSIQIFTSLINVDGNGCSLQMFIEEWLPLLVGIVGLLFLAAIIVQASKLKKNPKRKLRLLFLGTLVVFAIFIAIVLVYAYLIKVPA